MNRALRSQYLAVLDLESWSLRRDPAAGTSALPQTAPAPARPASTPARPALRPDEQLRVPSAPPPEPVADLGWAQLRAAVAACTRCPLSATRTQTVFGVGSVEATWLIVGEAPGAEEDRQGEPFVGRAGQLLNAMLRAIGLEREQVFIANVLKCRPPRNRDPAPLEAAQCLPYLERQIALLKPRIMLAVGRISAQNLLKTDVSLGRLRGQVHHFGVSRVPLVVTYHPAYLLREPAEKRKAWEDLQFAREVYSGVQR
jgi:uracil-DNA glycosylase family 4